MRAPSAAQAKQIQSMGAVPVAAPITEVYPGLERGTMDGAMVPFTTILDFRLGEVAKGFTISGPIFGRSVFLVAMNQKKYDSLSPARARRDRQALRPRLEPQGDRGLHQARQRAWRACAARPTWSSSPAAEQERISTGCGRSSTSGSRSPRRRAYPRGTC